MKIFKKYLFLVVLAVIGFLIWTSLTPSVSACGEGYVMSKKSLTYCDMMRNSIALKMFKLDNGVYPSTKEGNEALLSNPNVLKYPNYASDAYLEHLLTDSWGSEIVYLKTEDGFELISYGADRKEGGDDEDADIFYSRCGK